MTFSHFIDEYIKDNKCIHFLKTTIKCWSHHNNNNNKNPRIIYKIITFLESWGKEATKGTEFHSEKSLWETRIHELIHLWQSVEGKGAVIEVSKKKPEKINKSLKAESGLADHFWITGSARHREVCNRMLSAQTSTRCLWERVRAGQEMRTSLLNGTGLQWWPGDSDEQA